MDIMVLPPVHAVHRLDDGSPAGSMPDGATSSIEQKERIRDRIPPKRFLCWRDLAARLEPSAKSRRLSYRLTLMATSTLLRRNSIWSVLPPWQKETSRLSWPV
jgi:hypothetical protein